MKKERQKIEGTYEPNSEEETRQKKVKIKNSQK
jgi:hypothetical protein